MKQDQAAHAHPWKISDVVIFPLLALGLFAEWSWPTSIGLPHGAALGVGLVILCCGGGLILWTKRHFRAASQDMGPGSPTEVLFDDGPYSFSRNPNYLGAILALLGGAVAVDSLWVAVGAVLTAAILDVWMIRPEERYLAARFGDEYRAYCKKTRRWI